MSDLQRAIEIAVQAHKDQTRSNGSPYILHPLRVMFKLAPIEPLMIIGVLHDVVEDSEVGFSDLKIAGFSTRIVRAVNVLTKTGIIYEDYIRIVRCNELARKVKIADLEDNIDLLQLPNAPTDHDLSRARKYYRACKFLMETP